MAVLVAITALANLVQSMLNEMLQAVSLIQPLRSTDKDFLLLV